MALIVDIQDPQIRDFLMEIAYRSAQIRHKIPGVPEERRVAEIQRLNSSINQRLKEFGINGTTINPELMQRILKEGYYLDFHENDSRTEYPDNVYLGHVIEDRLVDIASQNHTFLVCHSSQFKCFGVSYPDFFQPQSIQVYTDRSITWLDFKPPVDYKSSSDYPKILSKMDEKCLSQLKDNGKRNYSRFPNKTLLEPSLN